jgi:hypothetical protein
MISAIFIIGMIYFYNLTDKSKIVRHYKSSLSSDLQKRYDKITKERTNISYQGYALGVLFSLGIIFYNLKIKGSKMNNISLVCIVVATAFVTNYFYYMLHPKSDWMLNHMNNQNEINEWKTLKPFPEPTWELEGVECHGKIYLIGGITNGWAAKSGWTPNRFVYE